MKAPRERSMAVQHYQALYGPPPPLTWAQVARGLATVAIAGALVLGLARGLAEAGDRPGPAEDTGAMQPELTR